MARRKAFLPSLPRFFFFKEQVAKPDYVFFGLFVGILTFGVLMLSSASAVVSFQKFNTAYYYVSHQVLFGVLPGAVLCFIASRIDYHYWRRFAFFFLVLSVALLVLVFIPGIGYSYGGAHRWMHLGKLLFQPSEVVKLTFLLYLGVWLSSKGEKNVKDFSLGFIPFLVLLGIIAFLVILQPDVGTMGIIAIIAFSMYVVAGARLSHVMLAFVGAIAMFLLLIKTAAYRLQRFMTFLHPELDRLGIGYHINQALLAVGSGGIFGRGFGHSRQKFAYLPEVTGDSIFAIIAEEMGLVFSFLLILLFMALAWRGLHIASRAPDQFGKLIVVGIISWITFQTFVNIGAMLSIVPLTGIPLPFISYGGSSLLVLMTAIGIVLNVSRQARR